MDHEPSPSAKFPLGCIVATPNALDVISNQEMLKALGRHARGDWGTLHAGDWKANDEALKGEGRLFSAYLTSGNIKFWIITEANRSVTTILLPEDY